MDLLRELFPSYDVDTLQAMLDTYKTPEIVISMLTEVSQDPKAVAAGPQNPHNEYVEILRATITNAMLTMNDDEKSTFLEHILVRYPNESAMIRQEIAKLEEAKKQKNCHFQETPMNYKLFFTTLGTTFCVRKVKREWLQHVIDAKRAAFSIFQLSKLDLFFEKVLETGKEPQDWVERLVIHVGQTQVAVPMYTRTKLRVLGQFFRDMAMSDLTAMCKDELLLNIVEDIRNDKQRPVMARARRKEQVVDVASPLVSLELLQLFDKEEETVRKKEKELEEQRIYDEAKAAGALIECECCMEECPFERMVQCPEGHLICATCVEKQVAVAVTEGKSDIPCAHMGGCPCVIPMSELKRTIPPKLLEKLVQSETMNAVMAADLSNIVKCYKCGMFTMFEGEPPMTCPDCEAKTCPTCGAQWHPDMTCDQYKEIDKDRLKEERMNEAVVRTCPKCGTQFMKDEGCNKMECPRCHTWICYLCHQVIPKNVGYAHFYNGPGVCPPDKCPLWVNNEMLHAVEAHVAKNVDN